jgi:putative membrane protein
MASPIRDTRGTDDLDSRRKAKSDMTSDETSVELSSRRTGMSFQRTRMSADRTLMSVIRTSLSLISFGFTIYQFFNHLVESNVLSGNRAGTRHFGLSLIVLGVVMLILGIGYHVAFMLGLRHERQAMTAEQLIHAESQFPPSMTLIVAVLLLLLGLVTIIGIWTRAGPFG